MNLTDFFVGGRQLFGFIGPGLVWISTAFLFSGVNPLNEVTGTNWIQILILLAIALIIGTAVETLSFRFAVCLSAKLHKQKITLENHDTDYFPLDVDPQLIEMTRQIITINYGPIEYIRSLNPRQLSQFCKRYINEQSSFYRRRFIEYELETNLLAMFVLPLITLLPGLLFYLWFHEESTTASIRLLWTCYGTITLGTIVGLLLYRLHPLRREEAEQWFQVFLSFHVFDSNKKIPSQ